jgi:hypothetical protein
VEMMENQLDRIEKKMDRILELLEGKEVSISLDGRQIAIIVDSCISDQQKRISQLGDIAR